MFVKEDIMKKVLLWHIALGFIYEAMTLTTMAVKNVNYTLILTLVFMAITCVGYLYFGAKEYNKNVFVTALILLTMTLVTTFMINPFARSLYDEYPLSGMLLFPYGGAAPFIQFGVYLAINRIYFGVILGRIALFIPTVLTVIGMLFGRNKKLKADMATAIFLYIYAMVYAFREVISC